ncbi:Cu(I)-responsive transcriptional regulator [Maricaulis maris]|uniref:Cu(I)-responsive transcriptional regulator n=1 Tax=Maricaulis maris TaxID=74318 RepID=A0A495D5T6_9PROT|nr:Cu(I)-responsive transcriptional regulator [Maricaulis maris]RKQ96192.1 Cu(I)-responsive transcriptional regulator [Maricaulis maris]
MQISEAARRAGLPVKTVRYYADIGLVRPPARTDSNYRDYDSAALAKLVFVRRARDFGFSIPECRELLALYEDRDRSSADVRALAAAHLTEIEEKQRQLAALRDELAHLVNACQGNDRPDCPILDRLEAE